MMVPFWASVQSPLPQPSTTTSGALPIHERMAFFWHDHFACAQDKIFDIVALWDQLGIFRRMAMGNFADLTRAVSVSPAMLMALDNQHNTVWEPQENFGRELMELYTCGVGHFTEADVVAMTQAWTGHNTVGWNSAQRFWDGTYRFKPDAHDTGQKTLFGITANWNGNAHQGGGRDTIDELVFGVRQQATASRLAELMFKHFANLQPAQSTIDSIAAAFIAGGMEISALVRAVLEHDDFWAPASHWAQVKNPMDWIVSIVQQTGISASHFGLRWRMENMGMVPLDPPSVAGWGRGTAWLNTASAWARGSFAESLRWRGEMAGVFEGLEDLDRAAAVDTIFGYYGIDHPSAATRNRLMAWFDDAHANHRWSIRHQARMLGALVPEFQVY